MLCQGANSTELTMDEKTCCGETWRKETTNLTPKNPKCHTEELSKPNISYW